MSDSRVHYLNASGAISRHMRTADFVSGGVIAIFLAIIGVVALTALGVLAWDEREFETRIAGTGVIIWLLMLLLRRSTGVGAFGRVQIEPFGKSVAETLRTVQAMGRSGARIWGYANLLVGLAAIIVIAAVTDQYYDHCDTRSAFCDHWSSYTVWLAFLTLGFCALNAIRLFRSRGPFLAFVLNGAVALAIPAIALAAGAVLIRLFLVQGPRSLETLVSLRDMPESARVVAGIAALVIGGVAFFVIWRWIRQRLERAYQGQLSATRASHAHVVAHDRRAPIIYLRSFDDDAMTFGERDEARPLDDVLAGELRHLGPFIAIGKPGELRPAGAARQYLKGNAWQPAVIDLMDRAQMIVAVAGWTPGLQWELENLTSRGHLHKAVFVIPPGHYEARASQLRSTLRGTGFGSLLESADVSRARVVHMAGDSLMLTVGDGRLAEFEIGMVVAAYATKVLNAI